MTVWRAQARLALVESIHARIKRLRIARQATTTELAKAAGVKRQTVEQWETEPGKGKSTAPARKRLGAVAEFLGVTPQELIGGPPESPISNPRAKRVATLFRWLTKEQQQDLLDDVEAKATTNQLIARELGGNVNPGPDSRVEKAIKSKSKH